MKKLENKVAIITGGAAGIGKVTAEVYLQEGAKVMVVDIDESALATMAKEIDNPNFAYCVADVAKNADTQRYVKETLAKFRKIDILFSNAGIEGTYNTIAEYPEEVFDRIIDINLKGVWLSCQYVIPKMEKNGSVIIASSVAGLKGFAGLGAYTASKHGVVGIMRVAAIENAPRKIRVNTIHPGPVETEMMRRIESEIVPTDATQAKAGFEAAIPFGRYATSEEVANLTLFLAADESKYITGCTFPVDGGMLQA